MSFIDTGFSLFLLISSAIIFTIVFIKRINIFLKQISRMKEVFIIANVVIFLFTTKEIQINFIHKLIFPRWSLMNLPRIPSLKKYLTKLSISVNNYRNPVNNCAMMLLVFLLFERNEFAILTGKNPFILLQLVIDLCHSSQKFGGF